jgi:hypothetical protein
MAQLDRVLDRYDLKTLEAAMQKRRSREQRRLADLLAKRSKLEAELRKLEGLVPSNGRRGRVAVVKSGKIKRRPNARRLNKVSLADALASVMASRKKPVHYKDLTDTVTKKKLYVTKSKNLLSTVAVTLKRDGRFKKIKPGLYGLR